MIKTKNKTLLWESRKPLMLSTLALLTLSFISTSSLAAIYYVDPQGSDSNPGTASQPWKTIAHAENAAQPGSTIYLSGENHGRVSLNGSNNRRSWDDALTFTRKPGDPRPVFQQLQISGELDHWLIFDDIHIDCPDYGSGEVGTAFLLQEGGYVKILNSEIEGRAGQKDGKYDQDVSTSYLIRLGIHYENVWNFHLENCEVHQGVRCIQSNVLMQGPMYFRNNYLHSVGGSHFKLMGDSNRHKTYIENNHIYKQLRMRHDNDREDVHGSGISYRYDYIEIRNNIIHALGSTSYITQKKDGIPSRILNNGYEGTIIENNLCYDGKNDYYGCELTYPGNGWTFRNNTIICGHVNSMGKTGVYYYPSSIWMYREAPNANYNTMEFSNNILCGKVIGGYIQRFGKFKGNHMYAFDIGSIVSQSWMNSNHPGNTVYLQSSGGYSNAFEDNGIFFRGPNLYLDRNDAGSSECHYIQLGDAFMLKAGSPAIGYADPTCAPNTALGTVETDNLFLAPPAARDGDPDSGAYEYGAISGNFPPIADAGQDQLIRLTTVGASATVTLDGSKSTDPDGTIVSYVWTENNNQIDTGKTARVNLPAGIHTITLKVTDDGDRTDTDTVIITVEEPDVSPPSILSVGASGNTVDILFDDTLDRTSAENVANYSIDGITITSAALSDCLTKVTLQTSAHSDGITYVLVARNIKDESGNILNEMSMDYMFDNGLVGYWSLDEGTGTTAMDLSGNSNDGTLLNDPQWIPGKVGQALDFDGTAKCVDCGNGDTLNLTGNLTLCAWINPRSFGQNGFGRIIDKGSGTTGFSFFLNDGSNGLEYVVYGGPLARSNSNIVTLNQWHHVAITHDTQNNRVTFYVNGQPAGATTYSSAPTSCTSPLVLGIRGHDNNRAFDGCLDDARVYNRALTPSEIQAVFDQASEFAFKPIGNKTVNEGQTLTFGIQTASPEVQVQLDSHSLPSQPALANNTFTWTATYDDAGLYDATFTATNGMIEDFETISITVNNVNRAPAMDSMADKNVNENSRLTFTVSAQDPDGDTLTYNADNVPTGATFQKGTFDWTPTYDQQGSYLLSVTATDGDLSDTKNIGITVVNENRDPTLDSIANVSVMETADMIIILSASDPDGDDLTYTVQNAPTGASLNGDTFTWTPSDRQAGTYNLTFTVSDGQQTDSQSVTLTVTEYDAENNAPVLAPIGNKTVKAGETLTFTISATDADNDPITYIAQPLPEGATFGSPFQWTPSAQQAGTYNVTFIASDGQLTDSQTISIAVTTDNTVPSDRLVGHWKLDETTGTAAADSSGNGNNATLVNGPTWTAGKINAALDLDGSNDYVNCGNGSSLDLTDGLTLAAWINPDTFGGNGWGRIFDKGDGQTGFSCFLDYRVNSFAYVVYGGTVLQAENNAITLNQWQHIAVTYDSDARIVTFYVNGQPAGTSAYPTPPADSAASPLVLGIRNYDSSRNFDGKIDDARVYNYALTQTQIAQLANVNTNTPPVIEHIADQTITEGQTLTFSVSAPDPQGDQVTITTQNLPAGAQFVSNTFTWTPNQNQTGTYQVTFTATDGQLSDTQTVNITVTGNDPPTDADLVAHYTFSENTGATAADSSEFGNTAQLLNGTEWTTGIADSAINLDGSDDCVIAPASQCTDLNSSLTLAAWIKPDSFGQGGWGRIIDKGDGQTGFSCFLDYRTNSLAYVVYGGTVANSAHNSITLNQWQHVAVTYDRDAQTVVFYVNGQPAGTSSYSTPPASASASPLVIGMRTYDAMRNFDGAIDDVRLYNTTLDAQRIAQLAAVSNTPPAEPIVIDNGDPQTSATGLWQVSGGSGAFGDDSLFSRNGSTYTYNAASTGKCNVYAWWTTYSTRATNAPYLIYDGDTLLDIVYVNQQQNGGQWNLLGTYNFNTGANVTIYADTTAQSVCADAVKIEPIQ